MKYVVIEEGGQENIFLFPSTLQHKDVARRLGGLEPHVISAGTVLAEDTDKPGVLCTGESTTLRVKSRGEADDILLRVSLRTYA
jgi:hypothetical protein